MFQRRRRRPGRRPFLEPLEGRCLLSGYTPAEITAAYGLSGIAFSTAAGPVTGNGAGETIALIETYHDPNLASDLNTFDQAYGLPTPSLTVIDQAGGQTDNGWAQEESMDVEWAHAIAPGANLLVVESAPADTTPQAIQNLMAAVNTASATPGVTVVSMSWGFNEFSGETAYDASFTAPGITYVAASGDSPGVDYPAASPDVLSVGGTTLNFGGGDQSQSAWPDSGGGYSQYEPEPAYQRSVQATGQRSTPDVAFDGDPNTGVNVYDTPPSGNPSGVGQMTAQGSWQVVGGTSLGAPVWAGIIAVADQGRSLAGLSSLTGATQTLPALYAASANDFKTVGPAQTSNPLLGNGGVILGPFGGSLDNATSASSSASSGANTQTGLGSPNGSPLIDDLVTSTITAPLPASFPSPTPTEPSTPAPASALPAVGQHDRHKKVDHKIVHDKAHPKARHLKRAIAQKAHAEKAHHPKLVVDRKAHAEKAHHPKLVDARNVHAAMAQLLLDGRHHRPE